MNRVALFVGVVAWLTVGVIAERVPPAPLPQGGSGITLTPSDALGFTYTDTDLATYAVTRFEVAYDSGAYSSLGLPTVSSAGGVTTYRAVPPQTNGAHTIALRACNSVGCGGSSSPFAFTVVSSAPTPTPVCCTKIPRTGTTLKVR